MRLYKHGKKCSIAFIKYFSKIRANRKRHNRVYLLSSEHTYRPMTARVVAQIFYNIYNLYLEKSYLRCFCCRKPENGSLLR